MVEKNKSTSESSLESSSGYNSQTGIYSATPDEGKLNFKYLYISYTFKCLYLTQKEHIFSKI